MRPSHVAAPTAPGEPPGNADGIDSVWILVVSVVFWPDRTANRTAQHRLIVRVSDRTITSAVIDEEGSNVSAGQRQLITISRAFISEPGAADPRRGDLISRHPNRTARAERDGIAAR